jgi:hypothetical protein
MSPPLYFRSRPGALRVLAPPPPPPEPGQQPMTTDEVAAMAPRGRTVMDEAKPT